MSCQHEVFNANVEVGRVVAEHDPTHLIGFIVDLKARCALCHADLEFIGLPVGVSHFGPTCSVDGVEARLNARIKENSNTLASGGLAPILTPPAGSA